MKNDIVYNGAITLFVPGHLTQHLIETNRAVHSRVIVQLSADTQKTLRLLSSTHSEGLVFIMVTL